MAEGAACGLAVLVTLSSSPAVAEQRPTRSGQTANGVADTAAVIEGRFAIRAPSGNYVSASWGGGKGGDGENEPLQTDSKGVGPWEKFKLVRQPDGTYAIQTANGHFVTAVHGGGMGGRAYMRDEPLQTDRTAIGAWETFTFIRQPDGSYAIQTSTGQFVAAVNGGGLGNPPLTTTSAQVGTWEKFRFVPQDDGRFAMQTADGHFVSAVNGGGIGGTYN
ncbi:MAG TPA: hypothetical protein VJY39_06185 [Acidisphaera sp.]|nr:hypothetical protein [Acidisphaera sp.]